MPNVAFTANLTRHVSCPRQTVEAGNVREALESVFRANRTLQGYVLDDRGGLRRHMVVFVDGLPVRDRRSLSDAVRADSEIFVMQALSGG